MTTSSKEKYDLISEETLEDVNGVGYIYKHKKTGAKIAIIKNDDTNKSFYIGFRTPPKDSTGVPHILEHSVLCGSEKFPSKEPFVELVKGSLNTFLNAMTYSDKTLYPVASCNDKDFQNLIHVYMDAVFSPNIYKKEEIFLQEGWNYNLESPHGELKYNGVVYNEMKGVFSSPEQQLIRKIQNSLFPDTTYGVESGGDPENITDLTYEEFLNFHSTYYHPSNSFIYLYGDMDFEEKLEWLDREYLGKFKYKEIDSEIKKQKAFSEVKKLTSYYGIGEEENSINKTYLSSNMVIGDALDSELSLAIKVLEYTLLGSPGAPLKQVLIDKGIGKDILSSFHSGMLQPTFSIIAKDARQEDEGEFIKTIDQELKRIVKDGLDKDSLKAAINFFEFRYLEGDFASTPRGLVYGLQIASSWIYDDSKPFINLHDSKIYEKLRQELDGDYYEALIKKYLLNNNHASILTLKPKKGLVAKNEKVLKEKLKAHKESLTTQEIDDLVMKTQDLKKYQEEPSKKEDLDKIPQLERQDISEESRPFYNDKHDLSGVEFIHHNFYTNGIAYIRFLFNIEDLPQKLVPHASLLSQILGIINTDKYSYLQLANKINIETGGIGTSIRTFSIKDEIDKYHGAFQFATRVFYKKIPEAMDLVNEIGYKSEFTDEKRLEDILNEIKSNMEMDFNSSGHIVAVNRARSYYSQQALFQEQTEGIEFYYFIRDLVENFSQRKEKLIKQLNELQKFIFTKDKLTISLTSDQEGLEIFKEKSFKFIDSLKGDDSKTIENIESYRGKHKLAEKRNEGLKTSSQVQYVARVGNFMNKGHKYTAALKVLNVILSYDYLWNEIRVKGGAYGCMSGFSSLDGEGYFVSYRDPNLSETNEAYENAPGYIRKFEADEKEILKYIIGTISNIDKPISPKGEGSRSLNIYYGGVTMDDIERERKEVLNINLKDIRKLADIIQAVLQDEYICALGNAEKIEENKEMFMETTNLI